MRSMMELIRDLSKLRLSPNSHGLDQGVELLQEELPFRVIEIPGGTEINGWIIPHQWEVEKATIHDMAAMLVEGDPIYDGLAHPLGVIGYSQSFEGMIKGSELKGHLFYCGTDPDALIYHCDLWYKPHLKNWGFSVPRRFYDSIVDEAMYWVDLQCPRGTGTMKIAEYVLPGESSDSIILNAHTCHAFLANDDLSGVAVGVELMRELAKAPRRFTYRLVLAPEHYGSIAYLDIGLPLYRTPSSDLKGALFLEMLGTTGPLVLQRSFNGQAPLDIALANSLSQNAQEWQQSAFRTVVGNDETCWEAAGYEIPCPSISRWPYDEYHTSKDSPELMSQAHLDQSVKVVLDALMILERNATMQRQFTGLVALSNPKYDLYKSYFDPSIEGRRSIDDGARQWNHLMNCFPRYMNGEYSILDIAQRFSLGFDQVWNYAKAWEAKGLVMLQPAAIDRAPALNVPPR